MVDISITKKYAPRDAKYYVQEAHADLTNAILLEGDYSSWSLVLDQTVTGTGGETAYDVLVSPNGSVLVDSSYYSSLILLDGSIVGIWAVPLYPNAPRLIAQSIRGKYRVVVDSDADKIRIFKDNVDVQDIDLDLINKWLVDQEVVGISSDGKYIGVYGRNKSPSSIMRIQIYEGS